MNAKDRELVVLLGIPFDNLDMAETVSRIEEFVQSGTPHYVATANVNFVTKAIHDDEFQEIVRLADIITADGMPLVWASRFVGHPLKERVTGSDLVPELVALAAARGWGVFFLGGETGVAEEAVSRLKSQYPGLKAGFYSPEFKPLHEMGNPKILAVIRDFAPQMLFVSLGAGKAEKWIRMHLKELGVPVCIGVGATIDFLAGRVKRAPDWMRRSGMEWLWRILQEPGRLFKRYLYDLPVFVIALLRQWNMERSLKSPPATPGGSPSSTRLRKVKVIAPGSRLDASTVSSLVSSGGAVLAGKRPLVVDLSATGFIDSSGLGGLVGLEKHARDLGIPMALAAPQPQITALIKLSRLDAFFSIHPAVDEAVSFVQSKKIAQNLSYVVANRTLTVPLEGRLDSSNSLSVREGLFNLVHSRETWHTMVLDLSRLEFMDSAGIGVLILLNKKIMNAQKELVLKNVLGGPFNALKLARLERYFRREQVS